MADGRIRATEPPAARKRDVTPAGPLSATSRLPYNAAALEFGAKWRSSRVKDGYHGFKLANGRAPSQVGYRKHVSLRRDLDEEVTRTRCHSGFDRFVHR